MRAHSLLSPAQSLRERRWAFVRSCTPPTTGVSVSRRLRARLIWGQTPAGKEQFAALAPAAKTKAVPEPAGGEPVDFDMPMAPRERAVALLHVGSEIEHALMVQYLYGAY